MPNPETTLQNEIRMALSKVGVTNWRNNTGALRDKDGRLVRYGLCTGSSDIIGIKPVKITEDMVGQVIGQFVAIEVKTPGKHPTEAQKKFLKAVRRAGGVGEVIRRVGEVEELV